MKLKLKLMRLDRFKVLGNKILPIVINLASDRAFVWLLFVYRFLS